jgi:hypothetical protein
MSSIKLILIHINYIQTVTLRSWCVKCMCRNIAVVSDYDITCCHTHPQINTEFLIYTSDPLGKQPWRLICNLTTELFGHRMQVTN